MVNRLKFLKDCMSGKPQKLLTNNDLEISSDINFFVWLAKDQGYDLEAGDWIFVGEDTMKEIPELEEWRGTPNVYISDVFKGMYVIPKETFKKKPNKE